MAPKIVFFPVDNGDMTLIELESSRTILIDVNIRESADDPKQEPPDVASMLRKRGVIRIRVKQCHETLKVFSYSTFSHQNLFGKGD
jgi:hypothetical protein